MLRLPRELMRRYGGISERDITAVVSGEEGGGGARARAVKISDLFRALVTREFQLGGYFVQPVVGVSPRAQGVRRLINK